MSDRVKDYNIVTLREDDLFKLLPYIVQVQDPGAIRHVFNALLDKHNFFAQKLREMPRLQDPTQAAKFSVQALGEDQTLYQQWLALRTRTQTLTAGEKTYMERLEIALPKSVRAKLLQDQVLSYLAHTVGEELPGNAFQSTYRDYIATAIARHHIKGSHTGLYLLGRMLGMVDIKATELWTRFTISDPANPNALSNDDDFAFYPEEYPVWPLSGIYDGVLTSESERGNSLSSSVVEEVFQLPTGSPIYTPFIVDDFGATFDVEFPYLSTDKTSPYYYNDAVNGHNPFGRFIGNVEGVLRTGTYHLHKGNAYTRSFVVIPHSNGSGGIKFESFTYGQHGDNIQLVVSTNTNGLQRLLITGPKSKIKFKSSFFDISYGLDAHIFPAAYGMVPVTGPDWPMTGTNTGVSRAANSSDWQMDFAQYYKLLSFLRSYVEKVRPLTRSVRKERIGFLLRDDIHYAPYQYISHVVLSSPNGSLWKLGIDAAGDIVWEPTTDAPTPAIIQRDAVTYQYYKWVISNDGVWSSRAVPETINHIQSESVVYFKSEVFTGFVFLNNRHIKVSAAPPESLTEAIHGDGTENEVYFRTLYANEVEFPPSALQAYMSDDAFPIVTPPERLNFQNRPEDELRTLPTLHEPDKFSHPAHLGIDEVEGFTGDNTYVDMEGKTHTNDIRLRFAGVDANMVEPVATGTVAGTGLRRNNPVQFLNYHGVVIWRDRATNSPHQSYYTYGAADPEAGGTLYTNDISGDGPVEGGDVAFPPFASISNQGNGCTPNDQVSVNDPLSNWQRFITKYAAFSPSTVNLINLGGGVSGSEDLFDIPLGQQLALSSTPYSGPSRMVINGSIRVPELPAPFFGSCDVLLRRCAQATYQCTIVRVAFVNNSGTPTKWRILTADEDGVESELNSGEITSQSQYDEEYTLPTGTAQVILESSGGAHRYEVEFTLPVAWHKLPIPFGEGHAMVQGNQRDCLELLITDAGESQSPYATYYRPDGSTYYRPDGVSLYLRPF